MTGTPDRDAIAPGDPASAGHFTTMQLRGGRVQGRDLHIARLVGASRELYGAAPDAGALRAEARRALARAGMEAGDCTLRIRIRADTRGSDDGGDGRPWMPIAAMAGPAGSGAGRLESGIDIEAPRHAAAHPLRLRTHAGIRACPDIKHLALEPQLDARRAARDAGFDDALLVAADGRVAEGTFWNIVFLDAGGLVWPEGPALHGVTQQLLQGAPGGPGGLPERREPVHVAAMQRFIAAWALNSTGIQDIASIDGHRFGGDAGAGEALRGRLAASPREPF
ncbi:aminotransferase class IV [Luteimonas sp. Sa2BVA3]|uniref:Aminotransferase class IV n=1 Tax=Luteimonas colneyensis TaxID=2762230 RepID=A0ABR8UM50_9GAMM|nr:aminotransferase class IV [Luteimonas colneyensis]MBD7989107.1 aminotransferase class IV [Luteimonas colneyensis]